MDNLQKKTTLLICLKRNRIITYILDGRKNNT
jgi:hypothetical protein